jgi:hypothetical protein
MSIFAETANIDYRLSFADQGKQTFLSRFPFATTKWKLLFSVSPVFCIYCTYIDTYIEAAAYTVNIYLEIYIYLYIYICIYMMPFSEVGASSFFALSCSQAHSQKEHTKCEEKRA